MVSTMGSLVPLSVLVPLLLSRSLATSINSSVFSSMNHSLSFMIGTQTCINSPRARELDLERVNFRDCIPLLDEILREPNINHRNQYNAATAYQRHLSRTCSITLLPHFADGTDIFWGYQIAIAAATAIKNCVEDSADQYGGLVFTTSRLVFYAQVKNLGDERTIEANPAPTSLETGSSPEMILPANSTDTTLLVPNPTAAIPACQISQPQDQELYPVQSLDCYYLFYNILTHPTIERSLILRGLSPIPDQTFGTCTLQLRGHSAMSADAIKYVSLLLDAVRIVQTCVVESHLVLGGAIGVGTRGRYYMRVYNPHESGNGRSGSK